MLHQDIIIQYSKHPVNYQKPDIFTHSSREYNSSCGDDIELFLHLNDGIITDAHFTGDCCAVVKASCSMMIKEIQNKPAAHALKISEDLKQAFEQDRWDTLPKPLQIFKDISRLPGREHCVRLPWKGLKNALG